MNVLPRSEAAVSKLPGHPPRGSAKAIAGGSRRTTVVPLRIARSCACPTRTPRSAVLLSLTLSTGVGLFFGI